jgi:hypothetical protein
MSGDGARPIDDGPELVNTSGGGWLCRRPLLPCSVRLVGSSMAEGPKLLPVIGPLIRASASIDYMSDVSGHTTTGLRSWRASREELGHVLPHGRGTSPDTSSRVTVPTNVAAVLQATLGGGPPAQYCARCSRARCCVPRVWRVRAWCGAWTLISASAGYVSLIFKDGSFSPAPALWTTVGYGAVIIYSSVGVIGAISTYEMAEIVGAMTETEPDQGANLGAGLLETQQEDTQEQEQQQQQEQEQGQEQRQRRALNLGPARSSRENPSRLFLRGLLHCEVSKPASQVLAQQVRRSLCQTMVLSMIVIFLAVRNLTLVGRWEHRSDPRLLLPSCAFFAMFLPSATIAAGWLIFLKAPCVIVCDRIKFSAALVRQMTSESAVRAKTKLLLRLFFFFTCPRKSSSSSFSYWHSNKKRCRFPQDYNAIMGYIQEAHELTVRLGVLLTPPLVGTWLMCTLIVVQWIAAASAVNYARAQKQNRSRTSNRNRRLAGRQAAGRKTLAC